MARNGDFHRIGCKSAYARIEKTIIIPSGAPFTVVFMSFPSYSAEHVPTYFINNSYCSIIYRRTGWIIFMFKLMSRCIILGKTLQRNEWKEYSNILFLHLHEYNRKQITFYESRFSWNSITCLRQWNNNLERTFRVGSVG